MPVPNAPGVPPTLDGFDAGGDAGAQGGDVSDDSGDTQWGIFMDGAQVIFPDSVYAFDFQQEFVDADAPQEEGAFVSYDKVQTPYEVRVRLTKGGSVSARRDFIESLDAIIADVNLYDVQTPEKAYSNVNFTRRDFTRQSERGATLLLVELRGVEIRNTGTTSFGNTKSTGGAGQQNGGIVNTEDVRVTGVPTNIQSHAGGGAGGGGGGGW